MDEPARRRATYDAKASVTRRAEELRRALEGGAYGLAYALRSAVLRVRSKERRSRMELAHLDRCVIQIRGELGLVAMDPPERPLPP
jgi:hypothetical protein